MRALLVLHLTDQYVDLFAHWRNPQIEDVKSRHKSQKGEGLWQSWALQRLSKRTADVAEGVCLGISFFILKMLYSKEPFGGLDYARYFIREFQKPIISHDGVSYRLNPLLESFSIALFLSEDTAIKDTAELRQVLDRHNIWKNTLIQSIPALKLAGVNTDLTIAAFKFLTNKSALTGSQVGVEVKRLIDIISAIPMNCPYSFWFFIEHFSQITSARGILFPFASEIMDIQKRRHGLFITENHLNIYTKLFKHFLSNERINLKTKKLIFVHDSWRVPAALTLEIRTLRMRKSHAPSRPISCTSESHSSDAQIPYQMHWFFHVSVWGTLAGIASAHSICFWQVEEKFLINETGLNPRQTPVVRGFCFNANIGLIEVEEIKDIDEFVATEIYKVYRDKTVRVEYLFYDS